MVTISLRFTAGRYCATPWGRQVNEGMVEWPPSPWRFLRALMSVWRRALPEASELDVAELLHSLAAPPEFSLPRASQGHTRHYMPVIESGQEKRSLIFDAFVLVPRDQQLFMRWPQLEIDAACQRLLRELLDRLPYFGRAESWCQASMVTDEATADNVICRPMPLDAEMSVVDLEVVPVLCADATPPPSTFLQRLLVDTGELRNSRRDPYRPPGSRWVTYGRPRDCLLATSRDAVTRDVRCEGPISPLYAPHAHAPADEPQTLIARYAIAATVRPLALRTVEVAEAARRAVMGLYGRLNGQQSCWRFSGKDQQGTALRGHQHAFYLPVDEDRDGFLDHLHVCVRPAQDFATTHPCFTPEEARALNRLRTLFAGAEDPLLLTLLYLGPLDPKMQVGGVLGCGRVWESVTPYLLPRHPKPSNDGTRWRADSPSQQLHEELAERFGREVADSARLEEIDACRLQGQTWSWQAFQRWRSDRRKAPPYRPGFGARITFREPIRGPIALGYGSHFGLGQFRCIGE